MLRKALDTAGAGNKTWISMVREDIGFFQRYGFGRGLLEPGESMQPWAELAWEITEPPNTADSPVRLPL